MNNGQLSVILTTVLDMAANNRAAATRIMKRFALAQALTAEGEFSNEDKFIISAAAILYEVDDTIPTKNKDSASMPIFISGYITQLLDTLYLPDFEVTAISGLVSLKKNGPEVDHSIHRLLLDIQTIVTLDEENADIERVKAARETLSHQSSKRRLDLMFGLK